MEASAAQQSVAQLGKSAHDGASGPKPKEPRAATTEGSIIGRFVAVITPILAAAAAWFAGFAAKEWDIKLDKGEIVAFMIAVVTAVLTSGWKWLEGLQKHEQRVAEQMAIPMREAKKTLPARGSDSYSGAERMTQQPNPTS